MKNVTPTPGTRLPSSRIESLLRQMTLDEKVGQLVQADLHWKQDIPLLLRQGRIGSILSIHDRQKINELQKITVEESRLGIPLIIANDVIHGYRTIFPIPLALASTWDPALVEGVARTSAVEAVAAGTHWNFAPMVDIARDPRWGRVAEGAGEDPTLGAEMAAAWVRGYQSKDLPGGRKLAACVKHFAAYGGAEAGKDYNTVDMSERRLRGEYLPPYHAALQAGAATVMTSFNELNGIPATANTFLMQDILRGEWGFEGVLVSDYDAIGELIFHGVATDLRQASLLAARAGVDMDMMGNAYPFHLADLVREGLVPEAWLDGAVRRVLALKEWLGLFEIPYADEALAAQFLQNPRHLNQARQAAEASAVLLKNEGGLLPLDPAGKTIALVGPLAFERQSLLGSWSCAGVADETPTFEEALRATLEAAGARLLAAPGCAVDGPEADLDTALAAVQQADLVILALGEADWMSGEAHSRAHLGLPGRQQELAEAVAAAGKPAVVVMFSGRPLAIPWLAEHIPALLLAWQGGSCAALALANLLLGAASPSGRLPISFPRAEGQIPIYYAHKSTGRPAEGPGTTQFNQAHRSIYLDESYRPLFPFGFGLGYTTFEYSQLVVETPQVRNGGTLVVSARVCNTGSRPGVETVQCYVRDLVGSVTRPVKELKSFQKVSLQPGEMCTARFEIPAERLAFWNANMELVVEPGEFQVWIGPNSAGGLEGAFEVIE